MVIGPDQGDLPVMRKLCRETGCDVWFPFYPLCMEYCISMQALEGKIRFVNLHQSLHQVIKKI